MHRGKLLGATALSLLLASPGWAQDAVQDAAVVSEEIVVTAQRQAESLQDVPIAVSAFSAEALERQQIENSSDLQLTLPNITFTKSSFTGSSFTIRGIGDLCVGSSCDQATAIHINGSPLPSTRLFETEFFDLERIEVLRGPQGTLFGRNATSGVVNLITAKPKLSGFEASAEAEYGNFDSIKAKGMVNVPFGDAFAARVAGIYVKRDGFTKNLFDDSRIDGRDLYSMRGSLAWEPTDNTTVDLMAYYFREDDDRLRIQKQLCNRDPTGVLGCLPNGRGFERTNLNGSFVGTLTSRQFLSILGAQLGNPALPTLALSNLNGPDALSTVPNPADVRTVNTDFDPTYFAEEEQYQARVDHDFGSINLQLTGLYSKNKVDSRVDTVQAVTDRSIFAANGGLAALAAAAAGTNPLLPAAYFAPIAAAIMPNGAAGQLCTSDAETTGTGAYGGFKLCAPTPLDFDRSNARNKSWSTEAILTSDFDGRFNFLLGAIYVDSKTTDNHYYVNNFLIDYVSGVLGSATALRRTQLATGLGAPALATPPSFQATPYFDNATPDFRLESYGIFGESYFDVSDRLKVTLGLRYNNDKKFLRARSTLVNFLVPYGSADAFASPFFYGFNATGLPAAAAVAPFDADQSTACTTTPTPNGVQTVSTVTGCEPFQVRNVSFDEWTGRAVLDYKITDDNLVYASYSRGYKSGGINPPLQANLLVPEAFAPEKIDAFEVGTKNVLGDGSLTLNLTGFYYKYKGLQLSRIVNRTAINDNVDADIYGVELESVLRPGPGWLVNLGASYLHTEVSEDKFLANPRDPAAGRSDVVVLKDIQAAFNCVVVPRTAGNRAGANQLVGAFNAALGLAAPAPFPTGSGVAANGAFSLCNNLAATVASPSAPLRALFATPTGPLPFEVVSTGIAQNINGKNLPQAPNYKFNAGVQYSADLPNGWSLVPRADLTYVGESFGNIFNGPVNRIEGYTQINAQLQLNGPDDRWFVRAFVQNLENSDATTGLAVNDQSQGVATNIFTLEPRRYGIAAGVRF